MDQTFACMIFEYHLSMVEDQSHSLMSTKDSEYDDQQRQVHLSIKAAVPTSCPALLDTATMPIALTSSSQPP